jgi:hypothetical protein
MQPFELLSGMRDIGTVAELIEEYFFKGAELLGF